MLRRMVNRALGREPFFSPPSVMNEYMDQEKLIRLAREYYREKEMGDQVVRIGSSTIPGKLALGLCLVWWIELRHGQVRAKGCLRKGIWKSLRHLFFILASTSRRCHQVCFRHLM
mmetsp:Transcript_1309/g.1664  ORF Transcript_1309/g.1664 Transcript_1309/m.1664 type:complete len:115 (+) Transcript_1309:271-615(+)